MDALFARYELDSVRRRVADSVLCGMRRKTQLIAALLQRPRLLITGEAMDGLDSAAQQAWFEDLRQIANAGGMALSTAHNVAHAESCADRVIWMNAGPGGAVLIA